MGRELETRVADGGPHAVAAFADSGIREADNGKLRQAVRDIDLNLHGHGVKPKEHRAPECGKHGGWLSKFRARPCR